MLSNHLILCQPILLLLLVFPNIRVFSNESAVCIRWPKYWSFCFSISPPMNISGLISFRIYWFDLLAVQGTLKSLFHHHSLKASMLQHSAFFMVQLSYLYMTTGKTIALTVRTLVVKWCVCLLIICCLDLTWWIDAFELWWWKRLFSPLNSKEIKPLNLEGNELWILIGRADTEVVTPIFWSPDANSRLIGKDPDAWKDWG